jgi:hypothetical protein
VKYLGSNSWSVSYPISSGSAWVALVASVTASASTPKNTVTTDAKEVVANAQNRFMYSPAVASHYVYCNYPNAMSVNSLMIHTKYVA